MFVPFGSIPSHLLEPLSVDTSLQYSLKKLKIPKTSESSTNQTLILAPQLYGQDECVADLSSEFSFYDDSLDLSCDGGDKVVYTIEINKSDSDIIVENASTDWLKSAMTSFPVEEDDYNGGRVDIGEDDRKTNDENSHWQDLANMYLGTPLYFKPHQEENDDGQEVFVVTEEEIDSLFSQQISSKEVLTISSEIMYESTNISSQKYSQSSNFLQLTSNDIGLPDVGLSPSTCSDIVTYAILTNVAHIWDSPVPSYK